MACVSGFTLGGYYEYIDCCGLNQTGLSSGLESVCVDETYSGSAIGLYLEPLSACTDSCNYGPLSYNFTVTGLCDTSFGTIVIEPFGGTLPYTIDNVIPGSISAQTSSGPFTYTGLTGGTYVFRLNDTLGLQNNELYINVNVTDCFTANILNVSGTTCGNNNGSFSVSATSSGSPYNIVVYKDNVFYDLYTTNTLPYQINNLDYGTYYATVYDVGYTTANTENVVISATTAVDFGFWKVNTSNCVIDRGKLAITGLTGTGPYTYLWSPSGQTTSVITGLTIGTYSCTVTDSLGCTTTKFETIGVAQPMGLGLLTSINPSCFSSDGSLTFTLTGGTAPFYFSATTSQVGYTLSDTFSITGLSSGNYNVSVRDANFCEVILNGFLSPVNGFNVVNTTVTNSNCDNNNGSIYVQIAGLGGYYVYGLSGQNTNQIYGNVSQNQNYTFNNLPDDTYLLTISGTGTECSYDTTITLTTQQKFDFTATTTGSTCFSNNGVIHIEVGTGYTGVLDYFLSDGQTIIDTNLSSYTFNNLSNGTYDITVTDQDGCSVTKTVVITTTGNLIATVNTTSCITGNDGIAEVIIYDGEPTFTYQWSNNVCCSQTGNTVTGLSAGTYTVLVTDNNGCQVTLPFTINCVSNIITNYESYSLCNNQFITTVGSKRGFLEMLGEGYIDIISGYTGCSFNSAEYVCSLEISGITYTQNFYTGYTNSDVPSDLLWKSTIEGILDTIPEVDSYNVDPINNILQIVSKCSGDTNPLADQQVKLFLTINYDVVCLEEIFPCITLAILVDNTTYIEPGTDEYLQYVDP